jgi:hypothetical protein
MTTWHGCRRKLSCPEESYRTLRLADWFFKFFFIIFNLSTACLKAYCAIWVRRFDFRHQASPRVSPRESTQRGKVELWARNVRKFYLNPDLHVTFRDLLHAVKLWHGTDGFTSPPKEGVLRMFFALKFRRLRPGANPRSWVPKANTLPLDHRSRFVDWLSIDRSFGRLHCLHFQDLGKSYISDCWTLRMTAPWYFETSVLI